ncbi:hypothetical protein B9Z19DRAFT_1130802 [Tuber borchii]|uniref:Uncharacterized protein n=1 Tax=Tuber borchii TaxID=42251 RepID=A0A2T6ZJT2_TUBBO|nr:hypothetical protein B9Z19DRAFT_1130802 [Tuber borchii]
MPRDYSENTIWTKAETERIIQWLEEPENLRKIKKGSGITKKTIVAEIAAQIPTKEAIKVGYKYDNIMKSYRAAAKLNNQSGWGLSERDLDEGRRSLRDKLLSRCPYFFRLERILGDRPNVRPPVSYDSGHDANDTAATIEQLLIAISNDNPEEEEEGQLPLVGQEGIGGEVEGEGENGASISREGEEQEREKEWQGEGMRIESGGNEEEVAILRGNGREEEDGGSSDRGERSRVSQETTGGIEEEEVVVMGENRESQGVQRAKRASSSYSSAMRGARKRRFPEMLVAESDNDGASSGTQRRRKGGSNALIEAVGILASAKAEGEEKKFEFLNRILSSKANYDNRR